MAKAWNYEGENLLRACPDVAYTIVRPGVMGGEAADTPPASLALADNGGARLQHAAAHCTRTAAHCSTLHAHCCTLLHTAAHCSTLLHTARTLQNPCTRLPIAPLRQRPAPTGDIKVSRITHADIASLCVQCLSYPNAARCTLTAMSVAEGEGAASWAPLLAAVRSDRRAFRTDLLQEHRRAVAVGGAALAVVAAAVTVAAGAAVRLLVLALVGLFTP